MNDPLNPEITAFARCPVCRELFVPEFGKIVDAKGEIDSEKLDDELQVCPKCGAKLDFRNDILPAFLVYHLTTQGVVAGEHILAMDYAIPVMLAIVGLQFAFAYLGFPSCSAMVPIVASIGLLGHLRWYLRYGRIAIQDPEFVAVRRRLRQSFTLWCALLTLNIAIFVYIKYR